MKRRLLLTAVALGFLIAISCAENTAAPADEKPVVVVMETSQGTIKIELDAAKAPITVKNFLQYADDKFYDGTVFHRVIENFMIQGGGFKPALKNAKSIDDIKAAEKTTRDPIKNEGGNGLSNKRGTIAMARTNRLDSATAQFFINVKDNAGLDNPRSPYCVFGKVIEGMDVVDKIKKVKTQKLVIDGQPIMEDIPSEDVVIKSVRRADK
jgi:cyclophilin family peptidyl-prolyl cis-trans isomerase